MSARETLISLAMLGGAGMTTETTDTTRLTDEQVQESLSWLSRAQQAENHTVAVALWANTYGHQLHAHITTLAAELDRCRKALEWYANSDNVDEEHGHGEWRGGSADICWEDAEFDRDAGKRARAALNGDTDDTD